MSTWAFASADELLLDDWLDDELVRAAVELELLWLLSELLLELDALDRSLTLEALDRLDAELELLGELLDADDAELALDWLELLLELVKLATVLELLLLVTLAAVELELLWLDSSDWLLRLEAEDAELALDALNPWLLRLDAELGVELELLWLDMSDWLLRLDAEDAVELDELLAELDELGVSVGPDGIHR